MIMCEGAEIAGKQED